MKYQLFYLFLFISGLVSSQNFSFEQGTVEPKSYLEEIGFDLVYEKIVIAVKINNKTYRFLVDTGAPNLISKELFEEIKPKAVRKIEVSDANDAKDSLQLTVIDTIKIGNLIFKNTVALVSDLKSHPALNCYGIDGFIGSNLLKDSAILFDLVNKKIVLTDDSKKFQLNTKASKLKLVGAQKSPYVEIKLLRSDKKKATETLLIDTGMDGLYDISNRAFGIFKNEGTVLKEVATSTGGSGMGLFGTDNSNQQTLVQVNGFSLNNFTFKNVITITSEDDNSKLGLEILKHGVMVLDFKRKKFYFEANGTVELQRNPQKINLTVVDNKFVIGFIWDENLKKLVSFGDEVLQINDVDYSNLNFCEMFSYNKTLSKDKPYQLTVRTKDNKIITLNIEP